MLTGVEGDSVGPLHDPPSSQSWCYYYESVPLKDLNRRAYLSYVDILDNTGKQTKYSSLHILVYSCQTHCLT